MKKTPKGFKKDRVYNNGNKTKIASKVSFILVCQPGGAKTSSSLPFLEKNEINERGRDLKTFLFFVFTVKGFSLFFDCFLIRFGACYFFLFSSLVFLSTFTKKERKTPSYFTVSFFFQTKKKRTK
eukprot:PhF_6_TR43648/c3_g1_i1/m.67072